MDPTIIESRLSQNQVFQLLTKSSSQFAPPLSQVVDLQEYSKKLANHAFFVMIKTEKGEIVASIAYYVNHNGEYIYIPYVWVDKDFSGKGYATVLFSFLHDKYTRLNFAYSQLEVDKTNYRAYRLYSHLGYVESEDRFSKYLMTKLLND